MGLFDTVASFGIPGNAYEWGFILHLPAGCANKVYQIVAAHERRNNFRFTSVQPGWDEDFIAGVHADIGGGYKHSELVYLPVDTVVSHIANEKAAYAQLFSHAAANGFMQASSTLLPGWRIEVLPTGSAYHNVYVLLRPKVTANTYAHVPLHIMFNKAIAAQVPFDKNNTVKEYPIPAELAHLEGAPQTNLPVEIWEKYIHVSATDSRPEVPYASMPRARYEPNKIGMSFDNGPGRLGFPNTDSSKSPSSLYPQTSDAGYDAENGANSGAANW